MFIDPICIGMRTTALVRQVGICATSAADTNPQVTNKGDAQLASEHLVE
jgi:hypothetical protein